MTCLRSPLASLIPITLGCAASRRAVEDLRLTAVRPGQLYRQTGLVTASATA